MEGAASTASQVNSFRIATVADRLGLHVGTAPKDEPFEFFNLCLSLARGIDYAVANDEVPGKAQDLPKLLKKVCERKTLLLQAAIMVLMVSVKSACKTGWFSNEDSRELLTIADEVASSFSSIRELNTEANCFLQNISTIMARYYPQLKMGLILSSVEAKPGYDTYLTDFHIPKNIKASADERVRLFVAQIDNIETSSCLITPPHANFLINGKGVDRRTNVSLEGGPLLPTSVMHMLKYGTNILQVVGQFAGNYVVVVAYTSVISNLDKSVLPDYVQHEVAVQDQDSELVEGPSRISLNCPISFQRIKTPVKGQSCKHIQCFDFDNYVEINSRRPSWRCPHCNQTISYVDICVDQYMAKVLKEVKDDVAEVIISSDGSYEPVIKCDENSNPPRDTTSTSPQDQQKNTNSSNLSLALLDLTECDDIMDESGPIEIEDIKPILADIPNHFEPETATLPPVINNNPNIVAQNGNNPIDADFWSRMFLSTYPQSQNNLQLLQSQYVNNSNFTNECGTEPPVTRPRVQVAVQALPALAQTSVPQQTVLRHHGTNGTSSMGDSLNTTIERQIQMSRARLSSLQGSQMNQSHFNPVHGAPMNSSQFQTQNWHHQNQVPHPTTPQTPLPTTSPRVSPLFNTTEITRQYSIPPSNLRVPHGMAHSPTLNRSSSQSPRNHIPNLPQQSPFTRRPSPTTTPVLNQSNRATPSAGDGIRTLMGEQQRPSLGPTNGSPTEEGSWRPTGRMRGALQGQAYSEALQQYIFQPVQPVQAAIRPPTLPVPLLMANSRTTPVPDPTLAPQ